MRAQLGLQRTRRVLLAALVVSGLFFAVTDTPAEALGTWHSLAVSPRASGYAVEGSARATFRCNDVTGQFQFRLRNVQVFLWDGTTRFPSLAVDFRLEQDSFGPNRHVLALGRATLSQNVGKATSNGLFSASVNGVMANPAQNCNATSTFFVTNSDEP